MMHSRKKQHEVRGYTQCDAVNLRLTHCDLLLQGITSTDKNPSRNDVCKKKRHYVLVRAAEPDCMRLLLHFVYRNDEERGDGVKKRRHREMDIIHRGDLRPQ